MSSIRIPSMILRVSAVLALLLGFTLWSGQHDNLTIVHMLLGLLVVASLWWLGIAQASKPTGSLGMTLGTFALGLIVAIFGMVQTGLLANGPHWIIQTIHLLLGLSAIGLGEIIAARAKRGSVTTSAA